MNLDEVLGQSPVIVCAHPDDETLWAGGLPIVFPEKNWTIICTSIPRRDPIRAWKFFDACITLGAMPLLLPVQEQEVNQAPIGLELIDFKRYDCVVTHNEWGEYGHLHHAFLSHFVNENCERPYVTFGYRKDGHGEYQIKLNSTQLKQKMAAMDCYNHFLEYEGEEITKSEALQHRYYVVEGIKPEIETYDIHE